MVLVRHLRRSSFRNPSGTHIWTPTANARNGVILSSYQTSTQVSNGQQHTLWPKLSHQDMSKSLHGASQTSKEVLIQVPFWNPYLDSNCECEKRCDSLISLCKHGFVMWCDVVSMWYFKHYVSDAVGNWMNAASAPLLPVIVLKKLGKHMSCFQTILAL